MKKIVISLGGSILVRGEDDSGYLRALRELLTSFPGEYRFIIITGGGPTAREYIAHGRDLGSDEATLDWIGIAASRLNAWLVISAIGPSCYPRPAEDIEEALSASSSFRFVVGGGTHPGHTTDTVSALIAERWKASAFLNLTAVPGAFTDDPTVNEEATRIDRMTSSRLLKLVSGTDKGAGSHSVMDPLAANILHRARLPTYILHGGDIGSVASCMRGEPFQGTVIEPDGG